jgi:hypothetical protein
MIHRNLYSGKGELFLRCASINFAVSLYSESVSNRFSVVPAAYVYLSRGDQVLLQRRQNTGYMDGMWVAGAAGHRG